MFVNRIDDIKVSGKERALLWDYRGDSIPVNKYIKTLQELEREIRYCKGRYPAYRLKLKAAKKKLIEDYENKIDRIYNDQRIGTYFITGEPFEPHEVRIADNLNMWGGITRYTELISGESTDYFDFMGAGVGDETPSFEEDKLEVEVVRTDLRLTGDINSDGIVLKSTAAFPPGVPNNTIVEFAGFDKETAGVMEYRVVIDPGLPQVQDVTFIQASHNTVFQGVDNTA